MEDKAELQALLIQAVSLNKVIRELLQTYTSAFEGLDLDDEDINTVVLSVLSEFEYNLIDVLDQIQGQIYLTTGVYEPLPVDEVDDFESSVLRTIGNLDSVDLEQYRGNRYE